MRSLLTLTLSLFCLLSFAQVDQGIRPVDLVQEQLSKNATFQPVAPFSIANQKKDQITELDEYEVDYDVLNINANTLKQIAKSAPEAINLTLPVETGNTSMNLQLVKVDIFTGDFELRLASTNQAADVEHGVHYRGIIQGDEASVVAISIFEKEVMGIIANHMGNLVLGKLQGPNWNGEHIVYNDAKVFFEEAFDCGTPDDGIPYKKKDLEFDYSTKDVGDCIRLYIEVDNDIYNDKGGTTGTTNYITGLMNEVITLYANENISSVVSQLVLWDVTSPYSSTSSSGMLSDFQANISSINGDLGQLFSYQASGGIAAGFSGICNPNVDNSLCFSSISSSYQVVPTYSWSVMVATHEFGHLWGSRHTHACVWNGNNTAIDGCAGSTEGTCSLPGYPSQGGTIMSYCHLQSVGINFNEGFGPQPGNVIRNSVANATCTTTCGPASCTDGIQNGNETGVDCGGPDCPACPTCNDGIQNGDEEGVDCGGSNCAPCPCNGNALTLTIVLDNYPGETTWDVRDGGNNVLASGGPYTTQGATVVEDICVPDGCYDFTIYDSWGDGICCGYGNGSYSLEDANNNVLASGGQFGSSETTNFCVSGSGGDTTPPTAPTNLTASNTTTTTTDLSWNASSDNVGVDGYYVYVDGSNIGSVTGTAATITGLQESTTYAMYVTAFDAAGNESAPSNTVSVTTQSSGGGGCNAGVLSSNSFETGWEGWSDGGSDCALVNSSFSWDGNNSIRLRDNSGTASSTTSGVYDLSQYSSVEVEFYFYPNSMENGEDFWVRYNDGSGWITVASYAAGSSFNNGSFYVATVTLNASSYNLSSNARFRFQCDASSNADQIYLDLVSVTGNCSTLPEVAGAISTIQELESPINDYLSLDNPDELDMEDIHVFPNPTQDQLNLNIPAEMNVHSVRLISVSGQQLRTITTKDGFNTIQVGDLQSGIYFLLIETDQEVINKKFVKQ